MPLINNSYFIGGERSIPNALSPEVASLISYLIGVHEKKYLIRLLGYELYNLFTSGIQAATPAQRYSEMLFGKTFTGMDGNLHRWAGFVTVTSNVPTISIGSQPGIGDIVLNIGAAGSPADGANTYNNAALSNKTFRVEQRVTGILESLKADNSNADTADIEILATGGFRLRNGHVFSFGDKYFIIPESTTLNTSGAIVSPQLESPIADYVYYEYLRYVYEQVTGVGTVQANAANATQVSPKHKLCKAYNDMVDKSCELWEMMIVNAQTYPEYQQHAYSEDVEVLLTKMNPFF